MALHHKIITCMLLSFIFVAINAHDVLIEAKGAAFIPTSETFKEIYGSCPDFGVEITAGNLFEHLYFFSSVDFSLKHGQTQALESPTKLTMVNFAAGLKYFIPFHHGDVYLGLGVQPSHLSTNDEIISQQVQWGYGGIVKAGVIIDLPHSLFTDIFVNYSLEKFNNLESTKTPANGCVVGVGFGYRFN